MNLLDILKIKKIPNLTWSSSNPLNFKPNLKTLIYLVLGLSLFALGETLLITANQGVSPWTVLAQGISFQTNLSIGVTTFIVSLIVLILWYPLKQKPGLGTILNIVLNGLSRLLPIFVFLYFSPMPSPINNTSQLLVFCNRELMCPKKSLYLGITSSSSIKLNSLIPF